MPTGGYAFAAYGPRTLAKNSIVPGILCAVGNRIMNSNDGINWVDQGSFANLKAVAYSPTLALFVAVGTNEIYSSPDSSVWTSRTPPNSNVWNAICWSPDLAIFCAVSGSGKSMISSDGISWTAYSTSSTVSYDSVCWSPSLSKFFATTNDGVSFSLQSSPDGQTWTDLTAHLTPAAWTCIAWSPTNALLIALVAGVAAYSSPDGTTWTSHATPGKSWKSGVWNPDGAVWGVVSNNTGDSNQVETSTNGTSWTARTAAEANAWQSICYSHSLGLFIAVASGGTHRVMTSPDGVTWTAQTAPTFSWVGVCAAS